MRETSPPLAARSQQLLLWHCDLLAQTFELMLAVPQNTPACAAWNPLWKCKCEMHTPHPVRSLAKQAKNGKINRGSRHFQAGIIRRSPAGTGKELRGRGRRGNLLRRSITDGLQTQQS